MKEVGCRPNKGQITKPKDDDDIITKPKDDDDDDDNIAKPDDDNIAKPEEAITKPKDDDDNIAKPEETNNEDDIIVQFQKGKDPHLLVATLIATVSFAAGFTMPGGYVSEKGLEQGQAILGRSLAFKAFLMSNTIALMFSSYSVIAHLFAPLCTDPGMSLLLFKTQLYCITFAMFAMVVSFITATHGVLRQSSALSTATLVLGIVYSILLMLEVVILGCFKRTLDQRQSVETPTTTKVSC